MDKISCFKNILENLISKKVSLFLGAGSSCAAGLPSGNELMESIKNRFPLIDTEKIDFMDICQDVIDTPPYTRADLEDFIKEKLQGYNPTTTHINLTKLDWSAIFTTNYDDMIEISYAISSEKIKSCQDIYQDNFSITTSDRSKMYLFKLMGSNRAKDNDGKMILTRTDYLQSFSKRQNYLSQVFDFIKNGTMVFVGYSFGDLFARDIIDEVIRKYGIDNLPYTYAIYDKEPKNDEKTKHFFSSRKIIPICSSFEELMEYLCNHYTYRTDKEKSISIKIKNQNIEIEESKYFQYLESFNFLTNDKIIEAPGDKDDFFKGTNVSWGAFKENWDFKRIVKNENSKILDEVIEEKLKEEGSEFNDIILLTGMAGCGKSTISRRIAFDNFKNHGNLVIYIPSSIQNIDYRLLADFIEYINEKYAENFRGQKHIPIIKPLLIFDDASSFLKHIIRIKEYLTSRGRSVLILAVERQNEWYSRDTESSIKLPNENIFIVNERFSEIEISDIVNHFYNLGYLVFKSEDVKSFIKKEFESSFFITIYSYIQASRKPFNEIIKDQYNSLDELAKNAFNIVCCFSQFNIPINIELLVRALDCSYEKFLNEIIRKEALKVIFEEEDEHRNLYFKAHHRIIAKKTVEIFFPDPQLQTDIFLSVFKSANLNKIKERELIEKLLIIYLNNKSGNNTFSKVQLRQFYEILCANYPTRSLIHHWGLLEEDCGDYNRAQELYSKALSLPRDSSESYKGESDQNIITSLGTLLSKKGLELLRSGKIKLANDSFEEAERCFSEAKHGEYPNVHAYHSHANMWVNRAKQNSSKVEKYCSYAEALEIISLAKDNINDDELFVIHELETIIWNDIGDEDNIKKCIDNIIENYNSPRGYYLSASYKFMNSTSNSSDIDHKELNSSLSIIDEACNKFPEDEFCIALKCKIWKFLYPDDIYDYFNLLMNWKNKSTYMNVNLLFDLGCISFIKEYYDLSYSVFEELQKGIGLGNKLRSKPRNPIKEGGKPKFFEGTIKYIDDRFNGKISCNSLRNYKHFISFSPVTCGFTPNAGDFVKYNIFFSFRGPRAENIVRI